MYITLFAVISKNDHGCFAKIMNSEEEAWRWAREWVQETTDFYMDGYTHLLNETAQNEDYVKKYQRSLGEDEFFEIVECD